MAEPFDVSVIIPSYNGRGLLLKCLRSFEGQTHRADRFEVVVVLDGSTDGSRQALEVATVLPLAILAACLWSDGGRR